MRSKRAVIVDLVDGRGLYLGIVKQRDHSSAGGVGSGCVFEGDITGAGDLEIRGALSGSVSLRGALRLKPGATLRSKRSVEAERVLVEGELSSSVRASVQVTVRAGGVVLGDVSSPRFALRVGGRVAGQVDSGGHKLMAASASSREAARGVAFGEQPEGGSRFDSSIPKGMHFKGRISGRGGVVISGSVDGDVEVGGTLRLLPGASLRGEARAARIIIDGVFEGMAVASEWLRVGTGAEFEGLGVSPDVTVDEEARLKGEIRRHVDPSRAIDTILSGAAPPKEPSPEPRRRRRRRSPKPKTEITPKDAADLLRMPRLTGMRVRQSREDRSND